MRSSRILIAEEKINVNQYVRELINNTGIISYSGAAREAENFTYKRHNFSVILSATTKGEPESPETMYLYNRAASLMTQMVTFGIKIGMEFIPGGCKSIPLLWITDKTSYEIQEEQRQALFQARFIRYIDVLDKKSLNILPHEISRIDRDHNLDGCGFKSCCQSGKYSLFRILMEYLLFSLLQLFG